MKEKILELRRQGKTYNEIKDILNCSKGTISYYCGKDQKLKALMRSRKNRNKIKYKVRSKVDTYLSRTLKGAFNKKYITRNEEHELLTNMILQNPVCYLTGEKIDLSDSKSYSIDHIQPFSKSCNNSIDNAGLCISKANQSKADLSLEEYLKLCQKVLENFGFQVSKKMT